MHLSLNILFGFTLRTAHRTQRPLPDPHHFIHQQVLGAWMMGSFTGFLTVHTFVHTMII